MRLIYNATYAAHPCKSMTDQNGEKPHRPSSPLEVVEQRIAARQAAETVETFQVGSSVPPTVGVEDEEPGPVTEDDPLTAWKRRKPGQDITLEQIHQGLIVMCEYSEAAIEGGIKMAADVYEIVQTVDQRTQQIATLTVKAEATSRFAHKVDEKLASSNKVLAEVRKDVQFLKDDMREVEAHCSQIPAIKEMLGEILARLPDPTGK